MRLKRGTSGEVETFSCIQGAMGVTSLSGHFLCAQWWSHSEVCAGGRQFGWGITFYCEKLLLATHRQGYRGYPCTQLFPIWRDASPYNPGPTVCAAKINGRKWLQPSNLLLQGGESHYCIASFGIHLFSFPQGRARLVIGVEGCCCWIVVVED